MASRQPSIANPVSWYLKLFLPKWSAQIHRDFLFFSESGIFSDSDSIAVLNSDSSQNLRLRATPIPQPWFKVAFSFQIRHFQVWFEMYNLRTRKILFLLAPECFCYLTPKSILNSKLLLIRQSASLRSSLRSVNIHAWVTKKSLNTNNFLMFL